MSVHDDYARAAMTVLLGRTALEPDADGTLGKVDAAKVEQLASVAHQIAQTMLKESCSWHGHDAEPVVDRVSGDAWWRCVRCGDNAKAEHVEDGRESLASVAAARGVQLQQPTKD